MWKADKLIYNGDDSFVMAYQGNELVWYKAGSNKIYYTSSDNTVIKPDQVYMPSNIKIVSNTYSGGQGVIEFNMPVVELWRQMFKDKLKLTSITYPSSVRTISRDAFNGADKLNDIIILNGVKNIANLAFANIQSGLSYNCVINIPASVESIGTNPFAGSWKIGNYIVDSNNIYYDSRNGCGAIIETATNKLIAGTSGGFIPNTVVEIGQLAYTGQAPGSGNLVIPSSVKIIGAQAFFDCQTLKKVTIPSSVTSIGSYGFAECSLLQEVIVNATVPPTLGQYAFSGNYASGRKIKVPAASLQRYKTAPGWKSYASSIVAQ